MPLLNTVGSASVRGHGRGIATPDPQPPGHFGDEYSGFNNTSPIQFNSPTLDSTYSPGTNIPLSMGSFIDHSSGKFFISYPALGTYDMESASVDAAYDDDASFYREDGSGATYFGGTNGMNTAGWNNGRGITIAYLSDAARTPVFVTGTTGSSSQGPKVFWFAAMDGTYLGRLDAASATTTTDDTVLNEGLAWDGFRLLAMFNGDTKVYRYTLPATLSTSGTIPTVALHSTVTTGSSVNYGMVWTGDGLLVRTGSTAMAYHRFLPTETSSTVVTTTFPGMVFSNTAIDYKNKLLVVGGWYSTGIKVYTPS